MEILAPGQRQLWSHLRPISALGFVLYDGTAIALRLGHRASIDFDFFLEKPLDRKAMNAAFPLLCSATVLQGEKDALTALVPAGEGGNSPVKVSFFGMIGFGRVGVPEFTDDQVLQVASPDDLMATKVKVVLQRAEAKDYLDIAAMAKAGVSLAKGLASAREMYGPNFQPSESLKALVYFADGDLSGLADTVKAALIESVSAVRMLPPVKILSRQLSME